MACLQCGRGSFRKRQRGEVITYYCDYCRTEIEYCHKCGAEIEERDDADGFHLLDCVERCGWSHILGLRKEGSGAVKSLMEKAPTRR